MIQSPSPNFNERRVPHQNIDYVVLHYTGMENIEAALNRFCDPRSEVSAHYMIDLDGTIHQLVNEDKRAWHAGLSHWKGRADLNSCSIGIELVNAGHSREYLPFPEAQIAALIPLLHDLFERYHLPPSALLAHSDIAPLRKIDPGELFPWPELAKKGLGLWPCPRQDEYAPATNRELYDLLKEIGYDCPADLSSCLYAMHAFQRHYHRNQLMCEPTNETAARARALLRLIKEEISRKN